REVTGTGRRPLPPELPPEPDTDSGLEPTAMPVLPTYAAPRDTPVETPVAAEPEVEEDKPAIRVRTSVDEAREKLAAENAERERKRVKQVRALSLGVFVVTAVVLFIGLLVHLLSPPEVAVDDSGPAAILWITSKPEGATIVVNGINSGTTPNRVLGMDVRTPHTIVLTKPGYRAWTRRFSPNQAETHLKAELELAPGTTQMVSQIPTTGIDAGFPSSDVGSVAAAPGADAGSTADAGTSEDAGAAIAALDGDAGTLMDDGGTVAAATPGPPAEPPLEGVDREMRVVDYPTRLLVLRPMYNALPVLEYTPATIDVAPGTGYSVWTEGSAAFENGDGTASGTLVYYAEGDLPADNAMGLVSSAPRTIKGAKKLHFFALDDTGPEDNRGSIRVHLRQSVYVPPRSVLFDPQKNAIQVKQRHQMLLRGMDPKSTYLITVRDDFAEVRAGAQGRVKTVLCVEKGRAPEDVRRSHRLFEAGKRYQVSGVQDLRCVFPDTNLSDNRGALDFDIVDVTNMSRKERAEALKGASRSER
ncbi:PEGA domain-containing protein, partial [Corallococcus praedator]